MQGQLLAGRYRLADSIGSGGMGRVWRAHDEVLHRAVAIKELTAALYVSESDQAVLLARTRAEARAAARINHSAVVTVHDVLEHDGRPWIVMELVEGQSLADAVKEQGRLEPAEAARVGLWVLRALCAAHAAGVLHRDVKPGNVLLSQDGRVLLTDFGIAQIEGDTTITRTGEVVGSVDYLAPERVRGHDPGPASDLWALGATLYTAVEGLSPFRRTSPLTTMQAVVDEEPRETAHAGPLTPVISALLRKDPAARPDATAAEQMLAEAAEGRRPSHAQAYVPTSQQTAYQPGTGSHGTTGQDGTTGQHGTTGPFGTGSAQHGTTGQQGTTGQHGTTGPFGTASGQQGTTGQHGTTGPFGTASGQQGTTGQHGTAAGQYGTAGQHGVSGHPATAGGQFAGAPFGNGTHPGTTPGGGTAPYGPGTTAAHGQAPAPAGAPHHPTTGPTTVGAAQGTGGGVPSRRRRLRNVALVVVLAAVVGGGTAVALQKWGPGTGQGSGTSASTAAPPPESSRPRPTATGKSGRTGPADSLPAGWTRVKDPYGFSIGLPGPNWQRVVSNSALRQVDYTPDGGKHFVRIAVSDSPQFSSAQDHQMDLEAQLKRLVDYHRVSLRAETFRDRPGSLWEYTWTALPKDTPYPGPRHAIEETYFSRDGVEYAIYMSSPEESWATTRKQFKSVLQSWRPGTS